MENTHKNKHPRAIILTYRAYPEARTNVRLIMDVAVVLEKSGWDVEIHAQNPKPFNKKELLPAIRGIRIVRHKVPFFETSGIWKRAANGFFLGGRAFLSVMLSKNPDLLMIDTTSPFLGLVGWAVNILRRIPYVYLVMEIMPEAGIALGKIRAGGMIDKIWRFANAQVVRRSAKVVTLGKQMKKTLAAYTTPNHIVIVNNWANSSVKPIPKKNNPFIKEHKIENNIVIAYSGNMGLSHELKTIVETAEKLQHIKNVKFLFIGRGVQRDLLDNMVKAKDLKNTIALPWQPEEILPYSLAAGDFAVVSLQPGLTGSVFPSRTYSAMAAGQALISIMDADHEIAQMVEKEEIGLAVRIGESDKLAEKIAKIVSMPDAIAAMQARSRSLAEGRFAMPQSTAAYERIARQAIRCRCHTDL